MPAPPPDPNLLPDPPEDTIEACVTALKAEGLTTMALHGISMTLDEAAATGEIPLTDWRTLLKEWRFLNALDQEKA